MTLATLVTDRLRLRPATLGDEAWLHALWTHPDVLRFLFDGKSLADEESRAQIEEFARHHDRAMGLWIMERRDDAVAVGEIGLAPSTLGDIDPILEGEIEFQIALHPDHWGGGYALEALNAVLDHAFATAGLDHVMGVADEPNRASRRLQEQAGFVLQRVAPANPLSLAIYRRDRD